MGKSTVGRRLVCASVCALALLLPALAAAQTPPPAYPVMSGLVHERLEPHTTYFCDPDAVLERDQAMQQTFVPLPEKGIAFGYHQDMRCWFRFQLENRHTEAMDLFLDLDYGLLDRLVLYQRTADGWVEMHSGDAVPFHERPLNFRKLVFPLSLQPGERASYLLSIETINSFFAPLELWQAQAFYERYLAWDWLIGGFYGIGLGMLIYNLFLWFSFRERAFLFYILYVGSTLMVLAGWHGHYFRLWPDSVTFNNLLLQNMIYLGGYSTIQFAREFLDTRAWPLADRLMRGYIWLTLAIVLAQLVVPAHWLAMPLGAMTLLCCSLAFTAGVIRWLQGSAEARIYVLAWSAFLVAAILIALGAYGFFTALPAAIETLQFAMVTQQVMLSIGLAMRINTLRRQRDERELAAARAQAESAAKTDFLAKMSHEIRTPMNAVLGITELMNDPQLSEADQRRYVDTLHTAGQTLMYVINDILDFSRMAAGKMQLEETDFDLHALVRESVSLMSVSAHEKSLEIAEQIAEGVPQWVRGDPIRIRQILLNLLGNAVKFTEKGSVNVFLDLGGPLTDTQVPVQLSVRDSGPGISEEELAKLFQPFEQLDGSSTRRFGGSGLGLAICQQLAELMGGGISVNSEPGEGSRFSVRLRLKPGEAQATEEKDAAKALDHLSVLVVEDNPVNQMVVRALLKKLGVEPRLAHNGREGLDFIKLNHGQLDLVFMDCEMPEMDGYQATRELRQWEQANGLLRMPVVAMTAHAFAEHRDKCYQAGMDGHVTKPLVSRDVQGILERAGTAARRTPLPPEGEHG